MHKRLLASAIAALASSSAFALQFPYVAPAELGSEAERASLTTEAGRFDASSGQPLALYQPDFQAKPASPEAMAREFLQARAGELRLAEAGGQPSLSARVVRDFGIFSVVRFEQLWQGLPVYGSEVVVSVTPSGKVLQLQQNLESVDLVPAPAARLDASAAVAAAARHLGAQNDFHHVDSREMWWVRDSAQRVWRLQLEPKGYPWGSWEVLVDAVSGEVVKVSDQAHRFDGTGRAFNPDPLSSAQVAYNATGYVDGNDASTPQLDAQIFPVTLRDLTQTGGVWTLVGPWASCLDWETPAGTCATDAAGTFNYTRDNDNFESVNVYHHIDTFMRYINVTLGVPVAPYQYTGGVRYDPRGVQGDDNSFYTSGTGRLSFGEGGVDDAEDADVVIHELGHGIHDWLTHGLSQVQGLSEGVGDYVAGSYSRSFNQWPTNAAAYFWTFNWDGHNPFWNGRITNYHLSVLYSGISTQIHTAGQYWASCNLLNYNSIGREKSDRAFLLGLAMTGSSTNQQDAAQAVLNAAATAGYSPAEVQAMYDNFTAGTTVPGNRRCSYVLTLPQTGWAGFANGFE